MDIEVSILVLFLLVFLSGYFSASETALFSLSMTKLKAYQSSPDPRKRLIAKLVLEPRDLLVTIFMLNTLANILIQNAVSHMFGLSASWLLKVGVPFFLMLIFGEIIPKYLGLQNNISLANFVAPTIYYLQNILKPIRKLIIKVTAPISHVMFFYLHKEQSISKEELKHVLKTSQEYGVLNPEEAELVWGYISLQEANVKELMRPRKDILFYDINDPLSKLVHLFVDQECSRLPICDKSLDNVIGILTVWQYFFCRKDVTSGKDLIKYASKPLYVPENMPAKALIRRFEQMDQVLALAVDEYGTISGLITREDIVEQVIGDITDLRDSKSLYTRSSSNEIIANALLEISEFNEIFNTDLKSEGNMLTIGGWLTEQLGEIPKSGTKFTFKNLLFQVLSSDPNAVRRLFIRKLSDTEEKRQKKKQT